MDRLKRFISLTSFTVFLLSLSCEIEDDFGKPDTSEYFGTKVYTSTDYLIKIIWSGKPNEIISISNFTISAIDVTTQSSREIAIDPQYSGSEVWIAQNKLYFINNSSELSAVDLSNSTREILVDSVFIPAMATPYSSNNFAFGRWRLSDQGNDPSLFLYDFNTKKETFITSGSPVTFSPDGQKLLFTKIESFTKHFYSYELQTKIIVPLDIQDPSYDVSPIIKWTSTGVLIFHMIDNYRFVELYNGTKKMKIGQWENLAPPNPGAISVSGDKIITLKEKCAFDYIVSDGCPLLKQYFSIVDVNSNIETELAYGNYLYGSAIFSPGEKGITFIKDNSIYLAEPKD